MRDVTTPAFSITEVTSEVSMDASNRGVASFTVTNRSPDTVRARASAVPERPEEAGWLSLAGDAERGFPPSWTEQYSVDIAVPAGTPAGRHGLRIDVEGLTPPHTDTVRGPAVTYAVRFVPPEKEDGYLATLLGALLGALAGGAVGSLPAVVVAIASGLRVSLELELAVLGVGAGLLGFPAMVAGAWLNLRQNHRGARETALVLAALAGGLWLLLAVVVVVIRLVRGSVPGGLVALFVLIGVLVPPVPARLAFLRLLGGRLPFGAS